MDFLKSGLKTVLGAPEPGQQPSPSETVERLVDRVQSSTLLEDRRDACRALKAMSRTYRIDVGALAMNVLKQVLELDRPDNETINYALDTLNNIMSPTQFEEEENNPCVPMNIGEQFTEIFIKENNSIQLVLDLLDEYDFRVRLSAVQLLTSVLTNRPKDIQEIVLVKPMAVSKMMDLLGDSREVIRNETLLLLIKLTKSNANIQKIVAFENAFDRLFEIVSSEGYADGGIIVEDCLLLMLNLLKNNSSNINFFKEGSYIQKMLPMFNATDDADEAGWSPQKVSNVHCMLLVVRALVSPSNSTHIVSSCQQIMKNVGLLDALCNILMSSGVPADILTETINTVGEVVRGNVLNQEFLGNVMAPSNPPRPAVVVLLMSMVNEKQPFTLRCAILYCFQCYLYRNEMSQAALVQTLLPSSTEVSSLTSGQLLCGGLFSSDPLSNWFSAVALMHGLLDNPGQKEQLLRVLLATNIGSSPVSLLEQCVMLLMHSTKHRPKAALLMLLTAWCHGCGAAVSGVLSAGGPWLVAQATAADDDGDGDLVCLAAFLLAVCVHYNDDSVKNYSKEELKQLIIKRVGVEVFTARVNGVGRLEGYTRAARSPAPRHRAPHELLLDYEYCALYRTTEGAVLQSISGLSAGGEGAAEGGDGLEQYKGLIRQQDQRLTELAQQRDQLLQHNHDLQSALADSLSANSHLRDENTLLKAQVSATAPHHSQTLPADNDRLKEAEDKVLSLEARISQLSEEICSLKTQLASEQQARTTLASELDKLTRDQDDLLVLLADQIIFQNVVSKFVHEHDDLLVSLADQDMKLNEYRLKLVSLGQVVEEDAPAPDSLT